MTHSVRITTRANQEITDAIRWYAENYSADFAARWYDGLMDHLDGLQSHPDRHVLAREDGLVTFDLREIHYGAGKRITHRAVFRIAGDTVEVLSIRHVAQRDLEPDDLN